MSRVANATGHTTKYSTCYATGYDTEHAKIGNDWVWLGRLPGLILGMILAKVHGMVLGM